MPPFIFFVRLPSFLDCIDTSKGLVFVFVYLFYIVIAADLLFHRAEMFPTEGLMREKKPSVEHEWKRNFSESAARTRALVASSPDNAFDLMCH